jgi:toxin-antitoxin system PIN domain toxin
VRAYLLDVNLLIALSDPMHVHHDVAHRWFASVGAAAWATCPITENGFVRITSHAAYPNRPGDAVVMLDLLRRLCAHPGHRFWPDSVSLREILQAGTALTHAQVTDAYLLGLAVQQGGRLATFDRRFAAAAIPGGVDALTLVPD